MASPLDLQCLTILQEAISSEFGLVIRTSDPMKARASLYKARKDLVSVGFPVDPAMAFLQIRVSPDDSENEVWLLRRNQTPAFNFALPQE